MISYRLHLRQGPQIIERRDFHAENDGLAMSAAVLVFEACSDRCDGWELWDGTRPVANQQTAKTEQLRAAIDEALAESQATIEAAVVLIEEGILAADGSVARSPTLRVELARLRSKRDLRSS